MKSLIYIISALCFLLTSDNHIQKIQSSLYPKIVLITIDGVRHEDMFDKHEGIGNYRPSSRELAPNMYRMFVDNGIAIGKASPAKTENIVHVSQPGYLEIISGYPHKNCLNNLCGTNTRPTLINDFAHEATVISGWDTIAKTFDNSLAVANIGRNIRSKEWRALKLADNTTFPDEFDQEEYRGDKYTQEAILNYINKVKQPRFMWLSLGNCDEWAHAGSKLQYWISLNEADEFIGKIASLVEPNTVFIITTDHGRSLDFNNHGWTMESGRVWIMIGGAGIPHDGFVKYDHDVYLSNIKPTILDIAKGMHSERSLLNYAK